MIFYLTNEDATLQNPFNSDEGIYIASVNSKKNVFIHMNAYVCIYVYICMHVYIFYIYIYVIHIICYINIYLYNIYSIYHWRLFRSSYRMQPWVDSKSQSLIPFRHSYQLRNQVIRLSSTQNQLCTATLISKFAEAYSELYQTSKMESSASSD